MPLDPAALKNFAKPAPAPVADEVEEAPASNPDAPAAGWAEKARIMKDKAAEFVQATEAALEAAELADDVPDSVIRYAEDVLESAQECLEQCDDFVEAAEEAAGEEADVLAEEAEEAAAEAEAEADDEDDEEEPDTTAEPAADDPPADDDAAPDELEPETPADTGLAAALEPQAEQLEQLAMEVPAEELQSPDEEPGPETMALLMAQHQTMPPDMLSWLGQDVAAASWEELGGAVMDLADRGLVEYPAHLALWLYWSARSIAPAAEPVEPTSVS